MWSHFFSRKLYSLLFQSLSKNFINVRKQRNYSLEPFLYVGIILLVLKREGKILEEKDGFKGISSWSDMSLFSSLRILVKILYGPSLLSSSKEQIILNTSELSIGVIKNDWFNAKEWEV